MNIHNFDGDELKFTLYNGKESVADGFILISKLQLDKYERSTVSLFPYFLNIPGKQPVAKIEFGISKTGMNIFRLFFP